MEVKAKARFIRISPRKARKVVDVVRGKDVANAISILKFLNQRGARVVEKLIKSVKSNAENNNALITDKLYIKKIYVDAGPSMKRFLPRAHGRATTILKRTSHITVVVEEKEEKGGIKNGTKGSS